MGLRMNVHVMPNELSDSLWFLLLFLLDIDCSVCVCVYWYTSMHMLTTWLADI